MENIPLFSGNRAEVSQNHDARKVVSATLSVLKLSGAIFRPISSKVSVQKNVLCPFHCKPRPSAGSLESPGLEYIPEVPGNRTEVGQNHDARKTVSATLSVLKWGYISTQKLESDPFKSCALCISLQTKAIKS